MLAAPRHKGRLSEELELDCQIAVNTEPHQTQQALAESERELAIHNRIVDVFLTVPDEEMYERVLDVVLDALDSRHGVFGYIDQEGSLVCPSMTREIFEQCRMSDTTIVFPADSWGGIWGASLTTMKSILSNSPGSVPDGHIAITRCVFVPIVDREELIGLLAVANRDTDYLDEDRDLMESVARRIGPILHARLARDVEEKERLRAEESLKRAIGEKDALLREIHHRVKNNMAVILSMISLQGEDSVHQETVDGMNKIRGRIRAMALAHDQLYRSEDFRRVDLGSYAQSLTDALFQTHPERIGKVDLQTRITDVAVTIDVAIPCGLILNELIGNSLEHAFPDGSRGEIAVALDSCEDGRFELAVTDNGVGFQGDADADRAGGFGLQLVELLAKQLGADLEMRWDHGADVRVRFSPEDQ
jgi:two-component sensor histidine kinase